jgi:hypothetical protein
MFDLYQLLSEFNEDMVLADAHMCSLNSLWTSVFCKNKHLDSLINVYSSCCHGILFTSLSFDFVRHEAWPMTDKIHQLSSHYIVRCLGIGCFLI